MAFSSNIKGHHHLQGCLRCLLVDDYHSSVVFLEGFLGVHRTTGVLTQNHLKNKIKVFSAACFFPSFSTDQAPWNNPLLEEEGICPGKPVVQKYPQKRVCGGV